MLITFIQILLLIIIAYQDFKSRSVSLLFLVLFGIFAIIQGLLHGKLSVYSGYVGLNLLMLIFIISMVSLYFVVKTRKLVWIFDTYLGWGDVVFFVTLCLVFSPANFSFFFVSALILSLIFAIISRFTQNNRNIPLAGLISSFLIPVLLWCHFTDISCYNDNRILQFLLK